ncbi:NADPH-dependent FMN reductase [Georgenia faecalis]|uniref:NADPH-dependent FMN reductase n=1 Tax=Georgenia faecalis TaxID=2483799 RepID=UPI000FDBD954|nr:NAD(P)H-dependent oxidoreductase [Georgenia faecalis]
MIRLAILDAATSPHRRGSAVAAWVSELARRNRAFEVDDVHLQEMGLPFFDEPELPRYRRYVHEHTRAWSQRIEPADAFIIVSPEYNRGYSALLKNALDYLAQEWAFKPVGLVSYGSGMTAGLRGAEALRPVLSALQMYPVREMVMVPFIDEHLHDGLFRPTEGMIEGGELMLDALVRMDAAMHLLRTPLEEIGDQQGESAPGPTRAQW